MSNKLFVVKIIKGELDLYRESPKYSIESKALKLNTQYGKIYSYGHMRTIKSRQEQIIYSIDDDYEFKYDPRIYAGHLLNKSNYVLLVHKKDSTLEVNCKGDFLGLACCEFIDNESSILSDNVIYDVYDLNHGYAMVISPEIIECNTPTEKRQSNNIYIINTKTNTCTEVINQIDACGVDNRHPDLLIIQQEDRDIFYDYRRNICVYETPNELKYLTVDGDFIVFEYNNNLYYSKYLSEDDTNILEIKDVVASQK